MVYVYFSTNWVKAMYVRGDVLKTTLGEMIEGEEYTFRVKAVNEAGPSEPSEPSATSIVAKPRFGTDFLFLIYFWICEVEVDAYLYKIYQVARVKNQLRVALLSMVKAFRSNKVCLTYLF